MSTLLLVRPNLGNPLIMTPRELDRFQITVAWRLSWNETDPRISVPSTGEIRNKLFTQYKPAIEWKNKRALST
jgi:hypothetical protein